LDYKLVHIVSAWHNGIVNLVVPVFDLFLSSTSVYIVCRTPVPQPGIDTLLVAPQRLQYADQNPAFELITNLANYRLCTPYLVIGFDDMLVSGVR
jgi:hypothetical protein